MQIPNSFQLLGHTYTVKIVERVDEEDNRGEIDEPTKVIKVKQQGPNFAETMTEESFCHELIHAMLDEMQYEDLSKDEVFVERMGRALHQALSTSR